MPPTKDDARVFIRVLLPDEQLRLYQLQPRVKLGSVAKSLKTDGSLYLGDRKIEDHETPESLELRSGIDNSVDFSFVPRPPVRILARSYDVPSVVPCSSGSNSNSPHGGGSDAVQQALQRLMKDSARREARHVESENDNRKRSDTEPTPVSTYNPRSNVLRKDRINEDSSFECQGLPNLLRPTDRPPRRPLPVEHTHADTIIPHTLWNSAAATQPPQIEPMSPHLQGTALKRQVTPSEQPEHSTVVLPQESATTCAPPTEELPTTTNLALSAPSTPRPKSPSIPSTRIVQLNNESPSAATAQRIDALATEVDKLNREVAKEREHRSHLEQQVSFLTQLLPADLATLAAEHEHQRLMRQLKEQRRTGSRGVSVGQ